MDSYQLATPKSTLVHGPDGGILAYHVPAVYLHNRGVNTDLAGVIEGIQVKGNTKHGGTYRSEAVTRHYLTWCGKGGKKPFRSAEYQKDGPTAERFIEASQGIWEEASEILRELLPGKWKNMMRWKYPEG